MTVTATPAIQSTLAKEKGKIKKSKALKKEQKVVNNGIPKSEEKRPRTTEWEKYADMLAQIRKFNPNDVYRRGGTLTKFGRERSVLGQHMRNGMDDDGSDTATSNFRASPPNSQRSSARLLGRVPHSPNRPTTGNNRSNQQEVPKPRRNSNIGSTTGRKFYFNPARSRVNESVSSTPLMQSSIQNTKSTPMPHAPYSRSYESVKSPINMRSHHSRSEMITLPPLEYQERTRSHSRQESMAQNRHHHHSHNEHLKHTNALDGLVDHNGSMITQNDMSTLTRHSSNTSIFSNSSSVEHLPTFRSSNLDVRVLQPPVKNTSSFLTTPRCSPFGLTKSYTDLYFTTTTFNKENKPNAVATKNAPKVRKSLNESSKKHTIK